MLQVEIFKIFSNCPLVVLWQSQGKPGNWDISIFSGFKIFISVLLLVLLSPLVFPNLF